MSDRRHLEAVPPEPPDDDGPTPPQDLKAEQSVIGSMLLNKNAIPDCLEAVKAHDFYRPAHELIYDIIRDLFGRGEPADVITVADELGKRGDLTRAGGPAYLHQLVQGVPTTANASYYAEIVHEKAVLRRLVDAGTRIVQMGYAQGQGDLDDVVNRAAASVTVIADDHHNDATIPHEQALYDAVNDLEASPGQPTPWQYLTNTIAGWKPGCLYLIGARPGIGKSVAGTDIALDTARRGDTAAIYSLEMSKTELYHRLIARVGTVGMDRIQHRRLTSDDWTSVAKASEQLAKLPLHVDDRPGLSLAQIHASIKAQQRVRDVGIVVIDYLQLITPPPGTSREDRRVQVDSISRGLKNLAKECNVPVVALTQLNRGSETRADKTPTLADLREAGGQEQDADVVLLLHRDVAGDEPNVMRIVVGKNRHGPQTKFELRFRGEHSRIEEAPWRAPTPHDRSHP